MNPCIIPPAEKKRRAPRRLSNLFASLENGSVFWLPGRRPSFVKSSFCTAVGDDGRVFINPFRSVLVKPTKETVLPLLLADRMETEPNPGQTHYQCDDCPGGHADVPVNNDNNIAGPTS